MVEHTPLPYRPRSVYGYALYLGSNILFLLYLVWAFVPEEILKDHMGLAYWPSKYWAVAIPIWIVTALAVFALFIYPGINLTLTPDVDDIITIEDDYSLKPNVVQNGRIPSVSDIPITNVCRKLYASENE